MCAPNEKSAITCLEIIFYDVFLHLLTQIHNKFQSINDLIAGKPYEQHVVSRYYAVENSSNDQKDSEVGIYAGVFRGLMYSAIKSML